MTLTADSFAPYISYHSKSAKKSMRHILETAASAIAGAIMSMFIANFLFGVSNKSILNGFAVFGAILGAAPDIIRIAINFLEGFRGLRMESSAHHRDRENAAKASLLERERHAAEQEARRKLLAAEHEARRPICSHCGKKTSPVFRHQKKDGSPDMRYHDNPVICNQCFKPYAGVRPWNKKNTDSLSGHCE